MFALCDIWTISVRSTTLYLLLTLTTLKVSVFGVILLRIFSHSDWLTPNTGTFYEVVIIIIGLQEQKLCNGKSILETIFLIKNVGKKRPTAEDIVNHIFYTTASNIDFSFINETIKYPILLNILFLKIKLMAISKLLKIPKPEILVEVLWRSSSFI